MFLSESLSFFFLTTLKRAGMMSCPTASTVYNLGHSYLWHEK